MQNTMDVNDAVNNLKQNPVVAHSQTILRRVVGQPFHITDQISTHRLDSSENSLNILLRE